MKRIVLALALTAFTVAAIAGENCCPKAKAAAAAKNQAACAGKDKAACAKSAATCEKGKTCPASAAAAKKVQSPKDAGKS